jgi:hypothetical protein
VIAILRALARPAPSERLPSYTLTYTLTGPAGSRWLRAFGQKAYLMKATVTIGLARADDLAAISSLILRTFHEGDGSARIIERAALAQGICGHPKETGGYHAHVFNCGGHLYRVTRAASPYAACVLAGPHQDAGRTAIHRVHDD